jgi:flagellar biosynthesis/type III secretory pathway chaperone
MSHDQHRRLEDVLDREIEAARLLAATLAEERTALTGDSPEAVQQKSAEKVRLLETIEKLEEERRALGSVETVADRWHALMELMAGCRAANEVNGYIIHMRQGQIRQLMDIVRGGPSITYGPRGTTSAKALRALARA